MLIMLLWICELVIMNYVYQSVWCFVITDLLTFLQWNYVMSYNGVRPKPNKNQS